MDCIFLRCCAVKIFQFGFPIHLSEGYKANGCPIHLDKAPKSAGSSALNAGNREILSQIVNVI
jgi:hypothetical protein